MNREEKKRALDVTVDTRGGITNAYLEEIATLCANSRQKTFRELSVDLGYDKRYITKLRHSHPQLVEMTDRKIRERFKEMSSDSVDKLYQLMSEAESETVQLNAAKEILSRAGYDAVQKVENTNKDIVVTIED